MRAVKREHKTSRPTVFLLALLLILPAVVLAEQLPVRTYTTADGLPRDLILRIVRDSHGFLWFCTADGLSRFNGYEFTTYGVEQGLPHPVINDLLETRNGVYWVATNGGGIARFDPTPARNQQPQNRNLFTVYAVGDGQSSNRVNVLYEDHAGHVWAGTDQGLFRLDETSGQPIFRRVLLNLLELENQVAVRALVEDREGSLYVSTQGLGLLRILSDGRTVRYRIQPAPFGDLVESLLFDVDGRLWIAHRGGAGLVVFKPEPASSFVVRDKLVTRTLAGSRPNAHLPNQRIPLPSVAGQVYRYTTADGLTSDLILGLHQSADGRVWISNSRGLAEFSDGRFRNYTAAQGLSNGWVAAQTEDRDGNLWLASATGAIKITWSGFTTFSKADGLSNAVINSVFENQRGELCATSLEGNPVINRFDGQRFTAVLPRVPRDIKSFGWGWNQVTLQDHTGEWWLPTGFGLLRFPHVTNIEQLAHTLPKATYDFQRGDLPGDDIWRLFEDSRGDIWISIAGNIRHAVARWERATESFHTYSEADGLTNFNTAAAYCEDAAGNLWLGFYDGGLARYRNGRFQMFTKSDGVPEGIVRDLYLDHAGRLWAATGQGGVLRIDDPKEEHPRFVIYTTADGLASNSASCITEDKLGRMYFGTARGLDRFDLETKRIRRYTKVEGLANNAVIVAFRDRQGALWFGTDLGLSRLIPESDSPQQPPPILISGLRIAGDSYAISALGETAVSGLVLNPNQNQLSIDFVGLGFAAGETLRYQYRLANDPDWSASTDQRTINYAGLPPGRYQFLVRALTADGSISPAPATISFTILRPIWQRWWFITLGVLMLGLIAAVIIRNRVVRLIELERVRTRIAADLHDDIGSGLSRIAILSEVARHQVSIEAPVAEPLTVIASASRDLVDSMSDIVWAINPNKDHLSDLVQRMRRFCSDLFTARQIEFSFSAPGEEHALKIGADLRRQVFLIFKEAVNNIARHADCTEAQIELGIEGRWLMLKVMDNGPGFDQAQTSEGQGLASMRARAEGLRGELQINSNNGSATTVMLKIPLGTRVSQRNGRVR